MHNVCLKHTVGHIVCIEQVFYTIAVVFDCIVFICDIISMTMTLFNTTDTIYAIKCKYIYQDNITAFDIVYNTDRNLQFCLFCCVVSAD